VRRRRPSYPPVPPGDLLPARTVVVPDRGEFFLRDNDPTATATDTATATATDADRPPVLLLLGWMVSADLN
jgi:hypothetical protein